VPTTLVGLLIFVAFITPGLLHYVQRRVLAPQRSLSPLVETATLASVSLAANFVTLLAFFLVRLALPSHTPDVGALLRDGDDYLIPRLPYIIGWSFGLLTLSCTLAVVAARWDWLRTSFVRLFAPVIVNESAWYHVFEEQPQDPAADQIYVGCDLQDGSYVAGILEWYSTETEDKPDRDLILGPPLLRRNRGQIDRLAGMQRLIVSAREITMMYVTWIEPAQAGGPPKRVRKAQRVRPPQKARKRSS
jgi:hypothetical protein